MQPYRNAYSQIYQHRIKTVPLFNLASTIADAVGHWDHYLCWQVQRRLQACRGSLSPTDFAMDFQDAACEAVSWDIRQNGKPWPSLDTWRAITIANAAKARHLWQMIGCCPDCAEDIEAFLTNTIHELAERRRLTLIATTKLAALARIAAIQRTHLHTAA